MERLAKIGGSSKTPDTPPPFKRAAVFGATGGIGRELVKDLVERGIPTRVVSRSAPNLARNFSQGLIEHCQADIRIPTAAIGAAHGCDVIFLCAGVSLENYEDHVLMARSVAQAMVENNASCLAISGYWSTASCATIMLHDRALPGAPAHAVSRLAKLRHIQEDILLGANACVAQLPDFFGPGASVSMINDAIASIAKGSTATWPGDPEAPRDFLFVPDAGRPLVELATRKDGMGKRIPLPGSGPMQPRLILEAAAARLNETLKLRAASPFMIKLAARFNEKYRNLLDLYPIYNTAHSLDPLPAKSLLGQYYTTPYPAAIDRTVRWMTGHAEAA
ncbi:MAG TPA: NAD-dependent epimerase/dehydratase family protein [Phycisphaerales bacterium]|nr:NAD-dependent epimerase/dehydratase family protein [Phycisphaerales bacterium]